MQLRLRLMERWAHFVADHPTWVISICGVLIALSILATIYPEPIAIESNYKDMLPEDTIIAENYMDIIDHYPSASIFYIYLDGDDDDDLRHFADHIVEEIRNHPNFKDRVKRISNNFTWDFLQEYGMLLSEPTDVHKMQELYSNLNLLPYLTNLNNNFESTYTQGGDKQLQNNMDVREADRYLESIELFVRELIEYLQVPEEYNLEGGGNYLANLASLGEPYYFDVDRNSLIISIIPSTFMKDYVAESELVADLETFIHSEMDRLGYESMNARLTGMMAIQKAEMEATEHDLSYPSLVALGLIILLFILSFRLPRYPIFIALSLIIGIIWTTGLIGATYHRLSMMTAMFVIILIGLGVDFGIHMVTAYTDFEIKGMSKRDAMAEAFKRSGVAVIIGGLTTSFAFLSLIFTSSFAFREFGVVTGIGILSCLLAMLTFLPAFLVLISPKKVEQKEFKLNILKYKFLKRISGPVEKYRWIVLVVFIVAAVLMGYFAQKNEFTTDMLSIEPQDAPAITAYRDMIDEFEMSPDTYLLELPSVTDCRLIAEELEKPKYIQEVAAIDSISYLIPEETKQREVLTLLEDLRNQEGRVEPYPITMDNLEELKAQIKRLENNIVEFGQLSVIAVGEGNKIVERRNRIIHTVERGQIVESGEEIFQQLIGLLDQNPNQTISLLNNLSESFANHLNDKLNHLFSPTEIITLDTLPNDVISLYANENQTKFLITIVPKAYLWKGDNLDNISRTLRYATSALGEKYLKDMVENIENNNLSEEVKQEFRTLLAQALARNPGGIGVEDSPENTTNDTAENNSQSQEDSMGMGDFELGDLSAEGMGETDLMMDEKNVATVDYRSMSLEEISSSIQDKPLTEILKSIETINLSQLSVFTQKASTDMMSKLEEWDLVFSDVTGSPVIFYELVEIFGREGKNATIYAAIAIFVLLILTFRSIKYPLLTIIPLVVGAIITIGLMYLLGIKFDFVNVTAVPIILGIGIDDGVHIVNRYIIEKGNITNTLKYTGRAVTITTLTTVIGFGTLGAMAVYEGFVGFGAVLGIGITSALLVSITLLPALLKITESKKLSE